MTISSECYEFFDNFSKVWQNFKDYSYLEGINLSQEQINIIEDQKEQLLIEGYAGTGKTLTLLYKFINVLVREENKKILFVTYNSTLIDDTIRRLNSSKEYSENKDKHKTDIMTFHEMASKVLMKIKIINKGIGKLNVEKIKKMRDNEYRRVASISAKYLQPKFNEYKTLPKEEKLYKTHNEKFITEEIEWIKAMGLTNLNDYMVTDRIGRSKSIRLTRNQRKTIFKIYEEYQKQIDSNKYGETLDLEDYALKIDQKKYLIKDELKYDYVFVDEVQDFDPMQIKALCILTKGSIVLSGDAKQRIYKKCPIKYEDLGLFVNQKGRRKILLKNYRSTAEIVKLANSLKFFDDKKKEIQNNFLLKGEKPIIYASEDYKKALNYVIREIKSIQEINFNKSIAIITREESKNKASYKSDVRQYLEVNLKQSIKDINSYFKKNNSNKDKSIFYCNVYDVKGLEFDIVFIMDFNRRYYPNKKELKKIEEQNEGKDIELINTDIMEFKNREKKLLYVAMTRAKEKLYIISNGINNKKNISNFIYDFNSQDYIAKGFKKEDIEIKKRIYNNYEYKSEDEE